MRTTLREKAILWVNGLTIGLVAEAIRHSDIALLSLQGLSILTPTIVGLTLFTGWMLHQQRLH
ncbi:MAG: hypothetical protein MI924_30350 [Chloroflexales bacterium]|nr:hypothetical protein [Chloroflexales bacterium]